MFYVTYHATQTPPVVKLLQYSFEVFERRVKYLNFERVYVPLAATGIKMKSKKSAIFILELLEESP